MAKKKELIPTKAGKEVAATQAGNLPDKLFSDCCVIIEKRKYNAGAYANKEIILMCHEIGQRINIDVLGGQRAEYGKQIVAELAKQLKDRYGSSFDYTNVRRMIQFAVRFPDFQIVSELAKQLSWSHFVELLPVKTNEAFMYYASEAATRRLGTKDLRHQIARKAYERREIANTQITAQSKIPFNVFKDPYFLDTLGLKDNYLEADLEKAILSELKSFILEFGKGFCFVESQKRMGVDDTDFRLDLLFYHRILKRLVVVELKMEKFKPEFKGQMELYLKWLNRYERLEGENEPIGVILCPSSNRAVVELLEMDKSGIAVAEFWTVLPPKKEMEKKIAEILRDAKERLERRKLLPPRDSAGQVDYFYESKDDNNEED
jgi:predicted nuclease of restriction endonuclease-like (RecB) superfamily